MKFSTLFFPSFLFLNTKTTNTKTTNTKTTTIIIKQTLHNNLLLCTNCKYLKQNTTKHYVCSLYNHTDIVTGDLQFDLASDCRADSSKCNITAKHYAANYPSTLLPMFNYLLQNPSICVPWILLLCLSSYDLWHYYHPSVEDLLIPG